ncbi:MAG: ComEA family DNA-binding protein [Actinobacteria bacterium]|nr:ComEA family DNA-binding protein [Actinomycetota bacterium]
MPGLTRQQLVAWAVVGLIILLVGANYLRGQLNTPEGIAAPAVTLGNKEDRPAPRLKVHVIGAVARPGLYELDANSRVADALEKAGGATPSADLIQINLAAKMADGQQLVVPEQGAAAIQGGTGVASGATATAEGGSTSASGASQPVNLNAATVDQLTELDGIGPKTAQKIIEYRDAHGGFNTVEELLEVPGIGPAKFEGLKGRVVI